MTWQIFSISRMFSLYFTITEAENIVLVLVRYVGIPMYFFFQSVPLAFSKEKGVCSDVREHEGSARKWPLRPRIPESLRL